MQLVELDVQVKEGSVDTERRNQWINLLVKLCQEIRLAFEVEKISYSYVDATYDEYMETLFL